MADLPVAEAAVAPFGEILRANAGMTEFLEFRHDLRIDQPIEEHFVDRFADGERETGDLAVAGHLSSAPAGSG